MIFTSLSNEEGGIVLLKSKWLSFCLIILLVLQLFAIHPAIFAETSKQNEDLGENMLQIAPVEADKEEVVENDEQTKPDEETEKSESTTPSEQQTAPSDDSSEVVEEKEEQENQNNPKQEEKYQEDKEESIVGDDKAEKQEKEENEQLGIPHPPFATTLLPTALSGMASGEQWPEPGSLNLWKDATPTSNYAEWEVELTVEGKNLKTSSDVVLVLDRSGSMGGQRLDKAKTAAKQFVNRLLTDDSTTRIALVTFSGTGNKVSDFTGVSGKEELINSINRMNASGGTHIQAGLHQAKQLLNDSTADEKTIVLLSDGEPTYSFVAGEATAHTWPNNKYNSMLSNFNYGYTIGSGSSYDLLDWPWSDYRYWVDGYRVTSNGVPTISEAKHIIDAGMDMYTIGLEVGNNNDATYVLNNSQNKGYYAGGQDDLAPIFDDIAAALKYPATDAVVTDPLGEMFDLVQDGSYNGENVAASHGDVSWDAASETFTWNIGNIQEDEVYTLTYKINLDCSKSPEGNVDYPTNKTTPLHYKDHNGNQATKQFPIPEVRVETGKMMKKGYRVNVDGDPVDSDGNVVSTPAEAELFYETLFDEHLALNNTYEVPANDVPDYTLMVGDNPTAVHLTAANVCETVWFGYAKTDELIAGDVTAKYVDEAGNELASEAVFTGNIGDPYTTEQKEILGYAFKEMHADSDAVEGMFTPEAQTVIYVYTKQLGTVTVDKVDDNGAALQGAVFELQDEEGNTVSEQTSDETGKIVFRDLAWGTYTLIETKAPDGYNKSVQEITVTIHAQELHVTKQVENTPIGWDIPKTGGIGTIGYYGVGLLLISVALFFMLKRRFSSFF